MNLRPALFSSFKNYNRKQFFADTQAGVIVGIVALPLAIAFAIASGVTPEKGLITAIIAGFIIAVFSGSRVQIGGPTGAFIIIVYGVIQQYGTTGLTIATIIAGFILIILGLIKAGGLIKFIPHPVVVGFTSGIALIILTTQIKDFLGLSIEKVPSEFIDKIIVYASNITQINYFSLAVGFGSLLIIILWQKISLKIPGTVIALVVSTVVVAVFQLPVDTIGSKFGEIPSNLPSPTFYDINLQMIKNLIQPATAIAILAAIESLLSAVVADGMIGSKHKSNMELVAQGLANVVTPIFGGIPATGAIARTATNIRNGGRTPVAGIVHSITLLLIMLFFGSYAKLIPMPALAAILVVVAYHMSEWRTFREIMKNPKSDIMVLLTTFGLTVIFDLAIAIEVGMVLAVILFIKRMAEVTNVGMITREMNDVSEEEADMMSIDRKNIPTGVEVFEINGPFFFGAADKFKEAMKVIGKHPKVRIIRMRNVPAIDSSGIHVLEELLRDLRKHDTVLLLSGVHTQPLIALQKSGYLDKIGEENISGNIDDSLDRAREILGIPKQGRSPDFKPYVEREKNQTR